MKRLGLKRNKVVKSVRIVTLSDVPPKFLLRPRVIAAIRREVLGDLRSGLNRVPAGCEADYKNQSIAGMIWQKIRGGIWKSK